LIWNDLFDASDLVLIKCGIVFGSIDVSEKVESEEADVSDNNLTKINNN